jgi:hypothetical protein
LIDFRYYIVTITAIFLALGIGVVTGATVLDRVTVDALHRQLNRLTEEADSSRADIKALRADRDSANGLVDALAPRVTDGTLAGNQVMFVHGEVTSGWERNVVEAIRRAGATDAGTLVLSKKWTLDSPEVRDDLRLAFGDQKLDEKSLRASAARILGKMLSDPAASSFVARLVEAGFLRSSPANGTDPFPPPGVHVVVFALPQDDWVADLARGSAGATPTLAVAPSTEELGGVDDLRGSNDQPSRLSTFDSGTDDRADLGSVLALRAAVDGNGGNFGRGRGLRYLPAPT